MIERQEGIPVYSNTIILFCFFSLLNKTDRQTKTFILKLWSNYMAYKRKTTCRIVYCKTQPKFVYDIAM